MAMTSFTPCESEVMRILWEHGELNPPQIQGKYGRPIKNAALRFQLRVLLGKGHVTRRKVGNAYYYKAVTPRSNALKNMASRMAELFSGGSQRELIAELIKNEKLSAKDIDTLKRFTSDGGDGKRIQNKSSGRIR
jgi:predicted transcriptional regulator